MKKGIIVSIAVTVIGAAIGGCYLYLKKRNNNKKKVTTKPKTTVTKTTVTVEPKVDIEKKNVDTEKDTEKEETVKPEGTVNKTQEEETPRLTNSIDYLPNVVKNIWEESKNSPKKKDTIPLKSLMEEYVLEDGRRPLYVYKYPHKNSISFLIEFPKINGKYDLTRIRERIQAFKIAENESYGELRIASELGQNKLRGYVVLSYTLTDDNKERCVWIPIPTSWALEYDKIGEEGRKNGIMGLRNLVKYLENQIEKKIRPAETRKDKEEATLKALSGSNILIDDNAVNILLEDVILAWEIKYPVQINKGPEEWGITPNQTIKLIKYFLNRFTQEVRFSNGSSTVSISRFDSLIFIDKLGSEFQNRVIDHDETADDQWLQFLFRDEKTSSIYELKIASWMGDEEVEEEDDDDEDD